MSKKTTKQTVFNLVLAAMFLAIGIVLPFFTGQIPQIGRMLLPMHLPVLLCGLICGWPYGAFCGIVGPVLSSILSNMPPAAMLVSMIPELCAYGLFSGLLMKLIRTGRTAVDLYLSLIPAMVLGRVAGGIAQAAFYLSDARPYSIAIWAGSYVLGTLPAIILQLILLPALVMVLVRAGLIPVRYPAGEARGLPQKV